MNRYTNQHVKIWVDDLRPVPPGYEGCKSVEETIALIEDGTLVFALATQNFLFEKMISNIQEIKARGANVITICKNSLKSYILCKNILTNTIYCVSIGLQKEIIV